MNRRELREQLFMLLFRKEFHTEDQMLKQLELYSDTGEDPSSEEELLISEEDLNQITLKCQSILKLLPEIDQQLSHKTEKWSLERIGKTELTILRLAIYEMLYDDSIPVGVAINEAVELSKKFCQDGAGSFVNGILAKFTSEGEDAFAREAGLASDNTSDLSETKQTSDITRKKGVIIVSGAP